MTILTYAIFFPLFQIDVHINLLCISKATFRLKPGLVSLNTSSAHTTVKALDKVT
jgi:hypothetical protein